MRHLARAVRTVEGISALALAAMLLLVCASVTMRYLFNRPIPDTFDLSRMFLGVAVFWGIAAACVRDDHIRGDLLQGALRPPLKNFVNAFAQILVLVFIGLLAWKLWAKTWDVARTNQETAELRWKIWPFYLIAWSALVLTLAGTVFQIVRALRGEEGDFETPASAEDTPEARL
jgi:TRAP-type C4-dicarboxylate transport system permease small subunit